MGVIDVYCKSLLWECLFWFARGSLQKRLDLPTLGHEQPSCIGTLHPEQLSGLWLDRELLPQPWGKWRYDASQHWTEQIWLSNLFERFPVSEPCMPRIWCFTTDPDVRWQYCDHLPLWTVEGSCTSDLACSRSCFAASGPWIVSFFCLWLFWQDWAGSFKEHHLKTSSIYLTLRLLVCVCALASRGPSYPAQYGNNEECFLQLGSRAQGGILQVNQFHTDAWW